MNISNKLKIIDSKSNTHFIKEEGPFFISRSELFSYIHSDISLDLKNKSYSIFASNGSGKTTMRKLIYACLDLNFEDIDFASIRNPHPKKDNNPIVLQSQNFKKHINIFANGKGHFFSDENNLFYDLDKIFTSKKEILVPWYTFSKIKSFSLPEGLKPERYYFNITFRFLFQKYQQDLATIDSNSIIDYTPVISRFYKNFNLENIFVETTSHKKLENSYNYFHNLYRLFYSVELIASRLKLSTIKFLENIQNNIDMKIEFLTWSNIDENCQKWFNYLPTFFKENSLLLNIFIAYTKEHADSREEIKQIILKYNIYLENNLEKTKFLFKKYFPNFFQDIYFKKRFSAGFDCDFYDLEIIDCRGKKNFLQSFYNIASEGEIKLLNLFIFLLEFDNSDNIFNVLLGDDFLSSFDNGNATNILRLLEDFLTDKKSCFINLTHEFQIFRLFNNIFDLKHFEPTMLKLNKEIDINTCSYKLSLSNFKLRNDFYSDYLKLIKHSEIKTDIIYLLCMLSHYRNVVEIYNGNQEGEYLEITNFLHFKDRNSLLLLNIFDSNFYKSTTIIKNILAIKEKNNQDLLHIYLSNKIDYFDLMNDLFHHTQYTLNWDRNSLESCIFYSLYLRIIMEEWMFRFIKKRVQEIFHNDILSNQTDYLIAIIEGTDKNKNFDGMCLYKDDEDNIKQLLDSFKRAKLYISEYMHIKYNEVSYLINIDSKTLYSSVLDVIQHIKLNNNF